MTLEYGNRTYRPNDNNGPIKLEPREQAQSPYNNPYVGGYPEICLATPSPQPHSPQTFAPVSPAPHYIDNSNVASNLLQQQLTQNQPQMPRFIPNNFEQHANHSYTPNILAPAISFANGSSPNWTTNNLNGIAPLALNRDFSYTSPIFQLDSRNIQPQPVPTTSNVPLNIDPPDNGSRISSNILMDLDSQILRNLSGELQNLSFSDIPMNSFSALESNDDKVGKNNQK